MIIPAHFSAKRLTTNVYRRFKGFTLKRELINARLSGFTLIELLIVIAILGILAAAVLVAVNPAKRQNQAKDSQTKSDIGQIATALQAYFTTPGSGSYPSAAQGLNLLVTNGDLVKLPTPPAGGIYEYGVFPTTPACDNTAASPCTAAWVSELLLDPATAGNIWCWESAEGTAEEQVPATAPCDQTAD